MSWCRWGSPCDFTFPMGLYKEDVACAEKGCPGSDLYIYESDAGIECCACRLTGGWEGPDFTAKTPEEMADHIEEHVAAGHHVRQSLRKNATREYHEKYDWLAKIHDENDAKAKAADDRRQE